MGIVTITGTLAMADGSAIRFSVDPEYGWSQNGTTAKASNQLGDTVEALDAIQEAMVEYWDRRFDTEGGNDD